MEDKTYYDTFKLYGTIQVQIHVHSYLKAVSARFHGGSFREVMM